MGNEIETQMTEHELKEFWGGDSKGVCIQVMANSILRIHTTGAEQVQEEGFIQLTMEEASALCNDLGQYIKREAMRRQKLLRKEIERLKITEKTIFHEISELSSDLMHVPEISIKLVSKFCPRYSRVEIESSE